MQRRGGMPRTTLAHSMGDAEASLSSDTVAAGDFSCIRLFAQIDGDGDYIARPSEVIDGGDVEGKLRHRLQQQRRAREEGEVNEEEGTEGLGGIAPSQTRPLYYL